MEKWLNRSRASTRRRLKLFRPRQPHHCIFGRYTMEANSRIRREFVTRGKSPHDLPLAPGVEALSFASTAKGAVGLFTGIAEFQPGATLPYHVHPCGEVILLVRGAATACVEGREYDLSQYDALFVPAGTPHAVENRSPDQQAWLHVSFPDGAPARSQIDQTFVRESRSHPPDEGPEQLRRFVDAESYELAPHTEFRDLFASRFGSDGVCGGFGRFAPGASLPCHIHDYDESISIVEGAAVCQVNGVSYHLSNNDTACIPEGRPHRFLNESDQTMAMIWVYAGAEPDRQIIESSYCQTHRSWPSP
jgi:putative monooxygenase